jgi:hypothetical protein
MKPSTYRLRAVRQAKRVANLLSTRSLRALAVAELYDAGKASDAELMSAEAIALEAMQSARAMVRCAAPHVSAAARYAAARAAWAALCRNSIVAAALAEKYAEEAVRLSRCQ